MNNDDERDTAEERANGELLHPAAEIERGRRAIERGQFIAQGLNEAAEELAHETDRFTIGQAVRLRDAEGVPGWAIVVGFGTVDPLALNPRSTSSGSLVLVELFAEYRGTVTPSSWPRSNTPPAYTVSVLAVLPENVTPVALCATCTESIEQTEHGEWIDSHTEPATSLVYCYADEDPRCDAFNRQRHTPTP